MCLAIIPRSLEKNQRPQGDRFLLTALLTSSSFTVTQSSYTLLPSCPSPYPFIVVSMQARSLFKCDVIQQQQQPGWSREKPSRLYEEVDYQAATQADPVRAGPGTAWKASHFLSYLSAVHLKDRDLWLGGVPQERSKRPALLPWAAVKDEQ